MKRKSFPELAKETLKRYLDMNFDIETCVIKDKRTGEEICFKWFLEHLEEDYTKMVKSLYEEIMKRGADNERN